MRVQARARLRPSRKRRARRLRRATPPQRRTPPSATSTAQAAPERAQVRQRYPCRHLPDAKAALSASRCQRASSSATAAQPPAPAPEPKPLPGGLSRGSAEPFDLELAAGDRPTKPMIWPPPKLTTRKRASSQPKIPRRKLAWCAWPWPAVTSRLISPPRPKTRPCSRSCARSTPR